MAAASSASGYQALLTRDQESAETTDVDIEQYRSWYPWGAQSTRQEIVLAPMGLDAGDRESLARLGRFLAVYFSARVRVRAAAALPGGAYDPDRGQYDAKALCLHLRRQVDERALAVVGVTSRDLFYHGSAFVVGIGSIVERVAVFSTRRLPEGAKGIALYKVAAHEVGHALGMTHCSRGRCVMNRCDDVRMIEATPLHLCPECLHKLHWRRGGRVGARLRALAELYDGLGFAAEAAHCRARLDLPGIGRSAIDGEAGVE